MGIFKKRKLFNRLSIITAITLVMSVITINGSVYAGTATLQLDGFQISTANNGSRIVYTVSDPDKTVVSSGLIFCVAGYATQKQMIIDGTNENVRAFNSTANGLLSQTSASSTYVMTLKSLPSAEYYSAQLMVRAYATLSDSSVIYSNTSYFSVYQVADYLYQESKMPTLYGHNYLYNNILTVVNPNYEVVEYNPSEPETESEIPTSDYVEPTSDYVEPTSDYVEPTSEYEEPSSVHEDPTNPPETTTKEEVTTFDESSLSVPDAPNATGAPTKSTLSIEKNWDTNEYVVSSNMWWGNNATRYILYEKKGKQGTYKMIATDTLVDQSSSAQSISLTLAPKTLPGTYWYKIVLKNKVGGVIYSTESNEVSIEVGGSSSSKIILDTIDADEVANQFIMSQGTHTYDIAVDEFPNYSFTVISSNNSAVRASIINGHTLKLEGLSGGRSGIKIIENITGETRQFGVRVKESDGSLAKLPNYLTIGQVSEDSKGDLAFWDDIDTDLTNKRIDMRYIYINGGPISGWQSWADPSDPGKRVKSYITESLKRGIIPYFVYYNIPDGSESYDVDLTHINDATYMDAYYKDLLFFLETCDAYDNDETVGIVLEPDFIGYMMQNANKAPSQITANGVNAAYTSGILKRGVDPDFDNTLEGLVKSINYIISNKYPNAVFGWQFNTWSYANGVPAQGLMHATETMGMSAGREFIRNAAVATANYYMSAGILSYGADFISIDKYGLDGAFDGNSNNPAVSNWFWNSDLWTNYLYYTSTLHEITAMPVTLWQLPVGHINQSQSISPYTNALFKNLTNAEQNYEDSAPTYFFGDTFAPGAGNRYNYFGLNAYNDPKVTKSGNNITYGSHMQEAVDAGVTCILFGAGVGSSTDAVGDPPGDDYWWITKAQQYYQNPVPLKYFNMPRSN